MSEEKTLYWVGAYRWLIDEGHWEPMFYDWFSNYYYASRYAKSLQPYFPRVAIGTQESEYRTIAEYINNHARFVDVFDKAGFKQLKISCCNCGDECGPFVRLRIPNPDGDLYYVCESCAEDYTYAGTLIRKDNCTCVINKDRRDA